MAIRVTDVFENHPELFDEEMMSLIRQRKSPFDFPTLSMTRKTEESKSIKECREPAVIIAGSGMCTGGRVKHHLRANISRPESTVLFVGYQAVGTLGRILVDGKKSVRLFGQTYPVKASVEKIGGFSGHADSSELIKWLSAFKSAPGRVFITHGEEDAAENFATLVRDKLGWDVFVPA